MNHVTSQHVHCSSPHPCELEGETCEDREDTCYLTELRYRGFVSATGNSWSRGLIEPKHPAGMLYVLESLWILDWIDQTAVCSMKCQNISLTPFYSPQP